jgi:hypothetical protein
MMERPVFPSDDGPARRAAPPQSPSRPAETARDHRIEAYLDEVFAPLAGVVPCARRQELRVELAAHLEALVEARRELGSEPDAAVRAALEQLGDARRLGREWARECRSPASRTPWLGPHSLRSTLVAGLTLLASGSLGASLLIGLEQHLGHNLFELVLGGPLLPLAAGAMVGRWHGRHPLGSRWGLLLIAMAGAGISFPMTAADPRPPLVIVLRVLLWLMTACASAGLGALMASGKDFLHPRAARF